MSNDFDQYKSLITHRQARLYGIALDHLAINAAIEIGNHSEQEGLEAVKYLIKWLENITIKENYDLSLGKTVLTLALIDFYKTPTPTERGLFELLNRRDELRALSLEKVEDVRIRLVKIIIPRLKRVVSSPGWFNKKESRQKVLTRIGHFCLLLSQYALDY